MKHHFTKKVFPALILLLLTTVMRAQHEHHQQAAEDSSMVPMSHSFSLHLPMSRNGSGTGWLPDSSAMYGHGVHGEKWMFMFHNNIFLRYNHQDVTGKGSRGGEKTDVPSWLMFMGQRKAAQRGLFRFSVMISPDVLSMGGEGYPLLFQSGETYEGKRLVDRQHPHDLFTELSVAYTHAISRKMDLSVYLAYPGEPALGPVAFMHRLSALNNPDAPLGHHWQDATHIDYGVATLGFRFGKLKVEASSFTGREPDENRYDFDQPRFDSYSGRISYHPNGKWALQLSQAWLKSPEAAEPDQDVLRSTASAIHHLPLSKTNRYVTHAFIWGFNSSDHQEHSFLFEPTLQLDRTAIYGRYEYLQKSAGELDLSYFNNGHETLFGIQAVTAGISQVLLRKLGYNLAAGMQGTLYAADSRLDSLYGKYPLAAEIYLRLYPHLMHMHDKTKDKEHSEH